MALDFPAIEQACRYEAGQRLPLRVAAQQVGSVARACLPAVAESAPWLTATSQALTTDLHGEALTAAFTRTNEALHQRGLITGWRDEAYALLPAFGAEPLARIERAAARFWGSLTFGAHANGYVAGADGRPTHLWVARRSATKATDPGLFDNLIGGGVPAGQSPFEALVREGWEEAGLDATTMRRAIPGRVVTIRRALPDCAGHGLQWEQLFVYDLALPIDAMPRNQDGEVSAVHLLPVQEAIALAAGEAMTVDASLATLDFALRHRLLPASAHEGLASRVAPLLSARRGPA
jgi:8-oxo-dGTP pyrophosphatase MutT (NUDIX family)